MSVLQKLNCMYINKCGRMLIKQGLQWQKDKKNDTISLSINKKMDK